MSNSLLLSRIESLQENLLRVRESLSRLQTWQTDVDRSEESEWPLADDIWMHLNKQVRRQFMNQHKELEKLRTSLEDGQGTAEEPANAAQAWRTYASLRDESERLFEESLEFIGGLAFRRTGLDDERMFELCDQLILRCACEAYAEPWHFLTVPSLRDVVTKSRARLSRVRFPEWTLWTLPVTAYVLGHEVLEEEDIAPLIARRMAIWEGQEFAHRHLHVLLADIFGAYVMGPGFGHASIRLRFDPSRAQAGDCDHPTEASRAHVVLRTLERMDGYDKAESWRAQVAGLREQWNAAVAEASPASAPLEETASVAGAAPAAEPRAEPLLDELVEDALDHFETTLNELARYAALSWTQAELVYVGWRTEARASESSALGIEPGKLTTPRDVLNAAWLLRLERPGDIKRIERAAADMCRVLLTPRSRRRVAPGQDPIRDR